VNASTSTQPIFHAEAATIIAEGQPIAGAIAAAVEPGTLVLITEAGKHQGKVGTVIGARRVEIHPDAAATLRATGRPVRPEHYLVVLEGALTMRGISISLDGLVAA